MFRKVIMIAALLAGLTQAQYLNHYFAAPDRASSEQVGYSDTYFADASAGNVTIPTAWTDDRTGGMCRGISADSTGLVKIAYKNISGETVTEVLMLIGGVIRPVRNVITVYRYYVGTTAGTAKSYNSSGSAVTNAIKLHR